QAEDGIRDPLVTGVQTCALPISAELSETADKVPGPLEASEGAAPEVTVHEEAASGSSDELSPEEQAVQGIGIDENADADRKEYRSEERRVGKEGRRQVERESIRR